MEAGEIGLKKVLRDFADALQIKGNHLFPGHLDLDKVIVVLDIAPWVRPLPPVLTRLDFDKQFTTEGLMPIPAETEFDIVFTTEGLIPFQPAP